ncbi:CoA transferase [Amycolatopsis sp.]|uniref:CaiB/BaiF CoA transferase family protein n=1 Tax=Amycolatopsis sp. TaxID=37632 RepID=UPI002BE3EDC8|nr:CoA transferase [Amycolatopsis sp.]HVV08391.1 CoA transferase [Amycolatopsis sp.]
MTGALAGVRVVDMTSTVMGPSSTQLLGDHGADVIKVESPSGDTTRHVPPMNSSDMGCAYLQLNRNKRSVVLDLKQQEHLRAMHELLKTADVFVYSIRPNAMARLGLSPEDLAELNPKLITVSLVGFGKGGPYTGRPVYEDLIQGLTAVPSLLMRTGSPEPHYVPVAFNDRAVGLFAASAMLAALFHRAQTGESQHIEVPMFESMAQFVLGDHMGGRAFEPPNGPAGYPRTLTPERRPYKTSDGYVCAIIYTDTHWRSFGKLVGRPDLLEEDERFKDLRARTVHAEETYAFVREIMPSRTTAEWLRLLTDADVPATPLHTLESIFDDPHLNATGFFERTEHPTEGTLLTVRGPANWSKTPPQLRRPAPHRGEHTAEVLEEIGYSEAEAQKVATAGQSWTA